MSVAADPTAAWVPLDEEQCRLLLQLLAPEGGWSSEPLRGRTQMVLSIGLEVAVRKRGVLRQLTQIDPVVSMVLAADEPEL